MLQVLFQNSKALALTKTFELYINKIISVLQIRSLKNREVKWFTYRILGGYL